MKHKRTAALSALLAALLAATLLLLAGCSQTVYATVTPKWQSNTEYDDDFKETLTYSVSFESSYEAGEAGWRFGIDAENSYYTVTVEAVESYQPEGGSRHWNVYHLHSELVIAASYAYFYEDGTQKTIVRFGGDSGTAPDRIVTDVWFHSLAAPSSNESRHSLEPIYSERTVESMHTPVGMTSDKVNWYNYTTTIAYNDAGEEAKLRITDNWGDLSGEERTVGEHVYKYSENSDEQTLKDLRGSYSAFDNAQLLFVTRGMNFSENSSETIVAVSETAGAQTVSVACSERADRSCSFLLSSTNEANGTTTVSRLSGTDIYAAEVSFSLANAGNAAGAARTFYFAQESGYYNAPLRMEEPVAYGIGTVYYDLVSLAHTE